MCVYCVEGGERPNPWLVEEARVRDCCCCCDFSVVDMIGCVCVCVCV